MGEASRRKDLVEGVRKKIGEQAAAAVGEVRAESQQLHLEHRALAREIEAIRPALDATKTAAAESRRYTEGVYREVKACSEREENLAARVAHVQQAVTDLANVEARLTDGVAALVIERLDELTLRGKAFELLHAERARDFERRIKTLEQLQDGMAIDLECLERSWWRRAWDWLRTTDAPGAVGDGV